MAEQTLSGRAELGAPMDYPEHNRTFAGFVTLTKTTTLAAIATLQALVLFGIANNGFWLGVLTIVLMMGATAVAVVTKGSIKALVGVIVIGFVFMALTLG